jgi:hypothetical protein
VYNKHIANFLVYIFLQLIFCPGKRHDREHPQHVQRHELCPGPTESNPGPDQRQGRLGHHASQDGQRAGCRANEIEGHARNQSLLRENSKSYAAFHDLIPLLLFAA